MGLENQKIGKYENPEDLAKALDEKDKTELADRIRKISKKAIEKEGKNLREILMEELKPHEQKEIVDALPEESWVKEIFLGEFKDEKSFLKEAAQDVIGEENVEKIERVEGFFNKIYAGIDRIWEVFKSEGIIAGIGAILLMLRGLLTGDFSGIDKVLNQESGGEKSEKGSDDKQNDKENELKGNDGNQSDIKENELVYLGGIQLLFLIKGDKEKDYIKRILLQDEVKTRSFEELNAIFKKGKDGISGRLGLTSKGSDEEVYDSIELIIKNESFINSSVGKIEPNWRKKKLGNILFELNRKGSLLNKIHEKLPKMELSKNPINLMDSIDDLLSIKANPDKNEIDFQSLSDRIELVSWVSKTTLLKILGAGKIKNSLDEKVKNGYYDLCEENEKAFIDVLFSFHGKIIKTMSSLFGSKNFGKFHEYFTTHGISPKNLIELYLITGGETKLENMDSITKSLLYLKIWKILGDDRGFRGEYFNKELLETLLNEKDIIPEDVKSVLTIIFSKTWDSFLKQTTGVLKEIYNSIPDTYKPILILATVFAFRVWYRAAPLRAVTMTAIAGIIAAAIAGTAAGKKYNKEQIEDAIKKYLEHLGANN